MLVKGASWIVDMCRDKMSCCSLSYQCLLSVVQRLDPVAGVSGGIDGIDPAFCFVGNLAFQKADYCCKSGRNKLLPGCRVLKLARRGWRRCDQRGVMGSSQNQFRGRDDE